MNSKEIFKENEKIKENIEMILSEKYLKVDEFMNEIGKLIVNCNQNEYLGKIDEKEGVEELLNNLCYEFGILFNKSKFINEIIIYKNCTIKSKFDELTFKMTSVPNVINIDANINRISIITQKFYNLLQNKYCNNSRLFKMQLGFMYLTPNRILNEELLSDGDKNLFKNVDIILKLEYIKMLYNDLLNILLCINCNYVEQ